MSRKYHTEFSVARRQRKVGLQSAAGHARLIEVIAIREQVSHG